MTILIILILIRLNIFFSFFFTRRTDYLLNKSTSSFRGIKESRTKVDLQRNITKVKIGKNGIFFIGL